MTVGPGDELKKCPFCNKDGKRSSGDEVVFLLCGCIPDHVCNEHDNDANVDFKTWQNAHCWKEIDSLTARIKELEGALEHLVYDLKTDQIPNVKYYEETLSKNKGEK